jgi:hypothetical protein
MSRSYTSSPPSAAVACSGTALLCLSIHVKERLVFNFFLYFPLCFQTDTVILPSCRAKSASYYVLQLVVGNNFSFHSTVTALMFYLSPFCTQSVTVSSSQRFSTSMLLLGVKSVLIPREVTQVIR